MIKKDLTAERIAEMLKGKVICPGGGEVITRFYAGDFLSRVMGKAPAGGAWLTVMANVNVAGVAVLADIKAVILCEGVEPDKLLAEKCAAENIALIKTDLPAFECCRAL
jgi:hypothetical protein